MSIFKPRFKVKKPRSRGVVVDAIKNAIDNGAETATQVAEQIQHSPKYVKRLLTEEGISLPSAITRLVSEETFGIINDAIAEDVGSIEDICNRAGINQWTLFVYSREFNFEIPHNWVPYRNWPEVDEGIDEGKFQTEMARQAGVSKTYVQHYIIGSGQLEQWRENRVSAINKAKEDKAKRKKDELESHSGLVAVLARLDKEAKIKGWAYQQTVNYVRKLKYINMMRYKPEAILKMLQRYEDAKISGRKVSLGKLGEGLGLYGSDVGRILRILDIEPMYGHVKRLTPQQRTAIERAFKTNIPGVDVAYFLGVEVHMVYIHFRRIGPRKVTKFLAKDITYRLGSQIYREQDLRHSTSQIAELLGSTRNKVDYVLSRKSDLAPIIIGELKIMFPSDTITVPYIPK